MSDPPVYPIIHPTPSTCPHSNVMLADCDLNEMEEPGEPVGPLDGKFEYQKNKDGTINKHVVICTLKEGVSVLLKHLKLQVSSPHRACIHQGYSLRC